MRMYDIIYAKRNGRSLTEGEIREVITGYTAKEIPDYQMSALLMAICFRGLDDGELSVLTDAMAHSGDTVDLSCFGSLSADKHSTGGVGDKTTLIVAPLAACLGLSVAKMSGRGLGHTGGTVDKLEGIPGYRTTLSPTEFIDCTKKCGVSVIGQSGNLTPADKMMYALRDVTATVDCVPLIAASVMSKKIAAGAKNIVLDVKYGSGSFLHSYEEAEALAEKMTGIGHACGRKTAAVLSGMDMPLGYHIGNILEVEEAVSVLQGGGADDLRTVCLALASQMASLARGISAEQAEKEAEFALSSGKAYEKFLQWISCQGGDRRPLENPSLFPKAPRRREITAKEDGILFSMNTRDIGITAQTLGAGRARKDDRIDPTAGIVLAKKTGDTVRKGELLATLYTSDESRLREAERLFSSSLTFSDVPPRKAPLIRRIIR